MTFVTEQAEAVALTALAWILESEEIRDRFLNLTGLSRSDLKEMAQDPELLAGILDFLLQNEVDLEAFCAHAQISLETPMAARAALPGGDIPHWT